MVPWNSTSVGLKTETTKIHFLSDVLVAVTSLDLKVPSCSSSLLWNLNLDKQIEIKISDFPTFYWLFVVYLSLKCNNCLTKVGLDIKTGDNAIY